MVDRTEVCQTQLGNFRLSPKSYALLMQDFKRIVEESGKGTVPMDSIVKKVLKQRIVDIKTTENAALRTQEAFMRNMKILDQEVFKGNEIEAVRSILEPTVRHKYEGQGSVWTQRRAIANQAQAFVDKEASTHKAGLKRLRSGELDEDIFKFVIDKNVNVSDIAKSIGTAFSKMNNYMLHFKNKVGFETRELQGWLYKQSHNAEKMLEMTEKEWTSLAKRTFDFNKMGLTTQDAIDEYLSKFYLGRVRTLEQLGGTKILNNEFKQLELNRPANLMAEARSVHFNNASEAYEYFKIMNPDKTLYDISMQGIDSESAKIALAEQFGPNYIAGYKALEATAKAAMFRNKGMKGKEIFEKKQRTYEQMFKTLALGDYQGKPNAIAILGDTLRKITNMSRLGYATITTLTDFATTTSMISKVTGESYTSTMVNIIRDTVRNFVSPAHRKELALEMATFAQDVNSATMKTRFGEFGVVKNWFDSFHNTYMRATGLSNQAVSIKLAQAKQLATSLGKYADSSFDKIPHKETLQKFGITANDWDLIRKSTTEFNGQKFISANSILDLGDSVIGLSGKEAMYKRLDLSNKVQQWMEFYPEKGSPTLGLKAFADKNATDKNTMQGQLVRMFTQFKSFSLSVYDTMEAIRWTNAEGKHGNIGLLAGTIAHSSFWGAVVLASKDLAKGHEPFHQYDFDKGPSAYGKLALESMLQAGVGGLWVDFAFADYGKSYVSLPSMVVGPAISGPVSDFAELVSLGMRTDPTKEKDKAKFLRQTFMTLEKNSPSFLLSKTLVNKNLANFAHKYFETQRRPAKDRSFFEFVDPQ